MKYRTFIKKVQRLNRINFKGIFLLFSLIAYGILPLVPAEFGELLLLMPAVFLLEEALNGKNFACPECKTRFKLRYAPLVIASRRCYCCGSKIFETPADTAPAFDRVEFIAYHRKRFPWKSVVCGLFTAVMLPAAVTVFSITDLRRIFTDLLWMVLELREFCFLIWFALFAIAYFLSRMSWSGGGKLDKCPDCGCRLTGKLVKIAIATSRCGNCGKLLFMPQSTLPDNSIYRLKLQNSLPAEFYWFTQALFSLVIVGAWMYAANYDRFEIPLLITAADIALLIYLAYPEKCRHHKPDRLVKISGNCGVCGSNLSMDRELFEYFSTGTVMVKKLDRGSNLPATHTVLIILAVIVSILICTGNFDGAVLLLFYPGTLFLLAVLKRAKYPFYALSFDSSGINLHGKTVRKIAFRTITGVEKKTIASRDTKRDGTVYRINCPEEKLTLFDLDFDRPELLREILEPLVKRRAVPDNDR